MENGTLIPKDAKTVQTGLMWHGDAVSDERHGKNAPRGERPRKVQQDVMEQVMGG